jgi:excisionase family DNA binding protein
MKTIYVAEKDELKALIKECLEEVFEPFLKDLKPERDLVDLNEITRYLNLSKSHIYKLSSKNEIPYRKFGKRLFFSKKELDEWILSSSSHHRTTEDMANEYLLKNKRKRF